MQRLFRLGFLAPLALAACVPAQVQRTPTGVPYGVAVGSTAPITAPPSADAVGPPPGLLNPGAGASPSPPTAAATSQAPSPVQGPYVGRATVVQNIYDIQCDSAPVRGFRVDGTRVVMGGFRGSIAPDGSVVMQAGGRYLYGQFYGSEFRGRVNDPPPGGCAWDLDLRPAG